MPETCLVTGSSRGIGLCIAKKFLENGYNVFLNCSKDDLEMNRKISELSENYPNISGFRADVSNEEECRLLFNRVFEKFGEVDILVNNAGISYYNLFNKSGSADIKRIFEVNTFSVFNTTTIALDSMIKNHSGKILNISSIWGNTGASCESVYSASKGAVNTFTKALAKELAPSGIRVNAIACGVIDTDMNNVLSSEEKKDLSSEIPLGRFGTTEEVADLAYFLCSKDADYLTGQIITIDGGMTV